MTLTQVNTAIETILTGGQSFTVEGVTYTQASLGTLQALRAEMMAQTSRATRPLFRAFRATSMGYGTTSTADEDIVKTVYP
jgi:hypothetical protein